MLTRTKQTTLWFIIICEPSCSFIKLAVLAFCNNGKIIRELEGSFCWSFSEGFWGEVEFSVNFLNWRQSWVRLSPWLYPPMIKICGTQPEIPKNHRNRVERDHLCHQVQLNVRILREMALSFYSQRREHHLPGNSFYCQTALSVRKFFDI